MRLPSKLVNLFAGPDPKLRRILGYWAATCGFYLAGTLLLGAEIDAGMVDPLAAARLGWASITGVLLFYVLIRNGKRFGLEPWRLALWQAVFAICCNLAAYAICGAVRGAALMVMLVVVVFCAFSLRPRQVLGLTIFSLLSLAVLIAWLVHTDPLRYPLRVETIHFALAALSLAAVAALTGEMSKLRNRLKQQKEELVAAVSTIRTLATIDELTSLANRRHMNEVLTDQEKRLRAQDAPLCLALLDIDFFKTVNDRFGHACGDAVLREFACATKSELRAADVLARWGGEEFLLLLPDTTIEAAYGVLERMAARIAATAIPGLEEGARITFSAGLVAHRDQEALAETINRADKAMYIAKSSGRNRIIQG